MVKRGDIWWANLPTPEGSEPGYKRPLVILQSDIFNDSKINTVICAVLTSNLRLQEAPGNFLLSSKTTGLPKDSVLNISQIITVDKSFLTEKVGELNRNHLKRLEESIKLILSINC